MLFIHLTSLAPLMQYLAKEQIIAAAEKEFAAFSEVCRSAANDKFFVHLQHDKWSVAENVQHLITATKTAMLAYSMPALVVRWLWGKPNRDSRSYEALVEKYQQQLAAGGRATGIFVPKPVRCNKEKLLQHWQKASNKFVAALKKCSESKLDDYLVRHPLLGRITLRELGYFTIYHTEHHRNLVNKILNNQLSQTN